jgi:hypothetical protein
MLMKILLVAAVLLAACAREMVTLQPTRLGTHQAFKVVKRGVCFGDADQTPRSPEVDQWRRSGAAGTALAGWSRDIHHGEGCDEHRMNVLHGKILFDAGDLPEPGIMLRAVFRATIREVRATTSAIPGFRRGAALNPDRCFDAGAYYLELSMTNQLNVQRPLRNFIQNQEVGSGPFGLMVAPKQWLDPAGGAPPGVGWIIPPDWSALVCASYIENPTLEMELAVPE